MKRTMLLKICGALVVVIFAFSACDTYKPNVSMLEAVKTGNEQAVKYYIKTGKNVNQKDENGITLLMLATKQGSVPVIKNLIKAGAKC